MRFALLLRPHRISVQPEVDFDGDITATGVLPSFMAGLNLYLRTASMAFSSRPMPSARTTRGFCGFPCASTINPTRQRPDTWPGAPRRKTPLPGCRSAPARRPRRQRGRPRRRYCRRRLARTRFHAHYPGHMPEPFPPEASLTLVEFGHAEVRQGRIVGNIMSFCTSMEGTGAASAWELSQESASRGGILPLMASMLSWLPPPPPAKLVALGALYSVNSIGVTTQLLLGAYR